MRRSEIPAFIKSIIDDPKVKSFEISRWVENSVDPGSVLPIIKIELKETQLVKDQLAEA